MNCYVATAEKTKNIGPAGPKAGGPNYLRRFASEQAITVNTAAAGGNASVLAQSE